MRCTWLKREYALTTLGFGGSAATGWEPNLQPSGALGFSSSPEKTWLSSNPQGCYIPEKQ